MLASGNCVVKAVYKMYIQIPMYASMLKALKSPAGKIEIKVSKKKNMFLFIHVVECWLSEVILFKKKKKRKEEVRKLFIY